jgi:osmotically inducible protein OsmC
MAATRRARSVWEGDLHGSGTVTLDSGVTGPLPVTWASRTEEPGGKTSPEELIAAAHAACLSMALSNELAGGGNKPEKLTVTATTAFEKTEPGWRMTAINLDVEGVVPGIDEGSFQNAAEAAKDGCPVSNALKNNVAISVSATLKPS